MKSPANPPNKFFVFLRKLRADGRTNMYGAIPYLMSAFGVNREAAFRIVCEWLDQQAALESPVPSAGQRRLSRGRAA
jgi:hypothetical protein